MVYISKDVHFYELIMVKFLKNNVAATESYRIISKRSQITSSILTVFVSSVFVFISVPKLALGAVNIAAEAKVARGSETNQKKFTTNRIFR